MSFRNKPFDHFSHFDPESRLSDFRRRFEQLSQNPNQVFGDSNRWTNSSDTHPMTKTTINGQKSEAEEEGIPIKVFHEKSGSEERAKSETNDEKNCDKNSDSMSSLGSTRSHRTSDTSKSTGSNASVFSNRSQSASSSGPSSQPRVHHIPITVEPRDGSTSSGYTSETTATNEQPLSRSSSHSSAQSVGTTGQTRGEKRSPSPAMSVSSEKSNTSNSSKGKVTQIPVKIESNDNQKTNGLLHSKTKPNNKPKSGPFVTRIPVVGQTDDQSSLQSEQTLDQKSIVLKQINKILTDMKAYEIKVNSFEGKADDKKYRYLDEMLTRFMIELDTIETNGDEEVRKERKAAVIAVNKMIALLESKVLDKNQAKPDITGQQSEEPMDISTPEPSDEQKPIEKDLNLSKTETQNICVEQNDTKTEDKVENCTEIQSQKNNSTNSQRKETAV